MRIQTTLRELKESWSLLVVLISAIAMLFLQFFLEESSSSFIVVALPTILLTLFFSLVTLRILKFEEKIQNILSSHLPEISFIDDKRLLEKEFVKAIKESQEFITTTGGKSELVDYLRTIEEKLKEGKVDYRRVVTGKTVTQEMFGHIERIIDVDRVNILWNEKEYLPMFLITENVAIFSLPNPKRGVFDKCIKIPNQDVLRKIRLYATDWMLKSEKIPDLIELRRRVQIK